MSCILPVPFTATAFNIALLKKPLAPKENTYIYQAPLRNKLWAIFNQAMFGIALVSSLALITGCPALGLTFWASRTAIPLLAIAWTVVLRKISMICFYLLIYPAVMKATFSRQHRTLVADNRLETFNKLTAEGYECRRISLKLNTNSLSDITYNAFIFVPPGSKIDNENWALLADGNQASGPDTLISEKPYKGIPQKDERLERLKELKCNILYVSGPGVSEGTGWATNHNMGAGAVAALHFLQKSTHAKRVVALGMSLGCAQHGKAIEEIHFQDIPRLKLMVVSNRTFSHIAEAGRHQYEAFEHDYKTHGKEDAKPKGYHSFRYNALKFIHRFTKPITLLTGIHLDIVACAKKLKRNKIRHVVIQQSLRAQPDSIQLPTDPPSDHPKGGDGTIAAKAALYDALVKEGITDTPRITFLGTKDTHHGPQLPNHVHDALDTQMENFFKLNQASI